MNLLFTHLGAVSLPRREVRRSRGKFVLPKGIFDYALALMLEITLDKLRHFSDRSTTMVTADAPLFGVVMIMNGQVITRGSHEAERIGNSLGFPPREQIIAEASRFWILHANGVRERKSREDMAQLLREYPRVAGVS